MWCCCADHEPAPESWPSPELASSMLQDRGYSNSNGNDYGMPHCESAPAGGLFQQELAALRKLGGPEGARGIDALLAGSFHSGSDSLEDMYPGLGRTVHGADYIQRYLQLLCALEGGHGPVTP